MSIAATSSARGWDETSGTLSSEVVNRFESAWRSAPIGRKPDPLSFAGDGPAGVRLALVRTDLSLRWETGESALVERYRGLGLSEDAMIALAYEEFCLREERGETPDPTRFYERFPEISKGLKRVLEIHDLVGSAQAASTGSMNSLRAPSSVVFPEAGQTIAGFHLVEELGRGGFARVFLAKERQLGDRLVALKVARTGSREPQTLARLQHTHIVPVHSYRIDPATGLHLLCMPYFGRVTLAHVLADPLVNQAREGSELVRALDRLDLEGSQGWSRTKGRQALSARPYVRAIAWWGARLAEALHHAHESGVLHRDVKPSNILVTADGMPLLLDFNLAHDPLDADLSDAPSALGGTVAYMSPEHLEALADGRVDGGDGRSDIYALGVVLFEAMGARPFGPPPASKSVTEALLRAAEQRKMRPPRLRERFPEVPASFDTVVSRCLASDPAQRYATAAELAEDLQAVADDLPLMFAREPILVRIAAKVRRHRRAMAATATVLLALGLAAVYSLNARNALERSRDQYRFFMERGEQAESRGDFALARDAFLTAHKVTSDDTDFTTKNNDAKRRAGIAEIAHLVAAKADKFLEQSAPLRFTLLGFDGDRKYSGPSLERAIKPFFVEDSGDWTAIPELMDLGPHRRSRLVQEIHELLFLRAIRLAESKSSEKWTDAEILCKKALEIRASRLKSTHSRAEQSMAKQDAASLPERPWLTLRGILEAKQNHDPLPPLDLPPISAVASGWECYCWGRLLLLTSHDNRARAVAWLDMASRRDPGHFWLEFDVAYQADLAGFSDLAFEHYGAAVELNPTYARARFNRARHYRQKGAWARALDDLNRAVALDPQLFQAQLELGLIHQMLGDLTAARQCYTNVINTKTADKAYQAAGRFNLASLNFQTGRFRESAQEFDRILIETPNDLAARQARGMLALATNQPLQAEEDFTAILVHRAFDADALSYRALAKLMLDRPDEADADAATAVRIDPSPRRQRLLIRTNLAHGRFAGLQLDDPSEIRLLPWGGRPLLDDLHAAANALNQGTPTPLNRSTRAVIFEALNDKQSAEEEASSAIAQAPLSPRTWLIRGRIRRDRGDRGGAMSDAKRGLTIEPDDPRLLELVGMLRVESGDSAGALAELDRAMRRHAGPALDRPRAEALTRLGQARFATEVWTRLVVQDPDDPALYVGRAKAFIQMANWDRALADLERAAGAATGRPEILASIVFQYARCLPARPDHWGRVLSIARKAIEG